MSPPDSGLVQAQWNILETALLAKDTMLAILRACAEEDVQGQAVLALEGLGFGLAIDEKRREEGAQALRTFKSRLVNQLKLLIGQSKGGLAMYMSNSQNLIASFLIVCACKICYKDETTAEILFGIMKEKRVYDSAPVSPWQVSQIVSSISGYAENLEGLLPSHVFTEVVENVKRRLSAQYSIDEYIEVCPTITLAQILADVFGALQNADVRRITVEGNLGGIWLVTFFLWLCPSITEYFVNGEAVLGTSQARLSIYLTRQQWEIQTWQSQEELGTILFKDENLHNRGLTPNYLDYYPIGSAKSIIQSKSQQITEEVLESIGQLAGALLDVAVSRGFLYTDTLVLDDAERYPRDLTRFARLEDICSETFLQSYPSAMQRYGWICGEEFRNRKESVKNALQLFLNAKSRFKMNNLEDGNDLDAMKDVIYQCYLESCRNGEAILPVHEDVLMNVADQAIHLAGEALLGSLVGRDMLRYASFRPPIPKYLNANAERLRRFIFGHPKESTSATIYSYSKLRVDTLEAVIPGTPPTAPTGELAVVFNGYVAYSAILELTADKMTDPRQASEVRVIPGSLRLTDGKDSLSKEERGHFARLLERKVGNSVAGRILCFNPKPVQAFGPGGKYTGFESLIDPHQTRIEHLVTSSYSQDRTLWLTTQYRSAAGLENASTSLLLPRSLGVSDEAPPIPVSWERSMKAITFAKHVTEYNVLPEQMRQLSKLWRDRGYLSELRLVWAPPGHAVARGQSGDRKRRYVSMTASNEQLRFFEAGYLAGGRQLYVGHKPPLEQCLKEAFANVEDFPDWAIIA